MQLIKKQTIRLNNGWFVFYLTYHYVFHHSLQQKSMWKINTRQTYAEFL